MKQWFSGIARRYHSWERLQDTQMSRKQDSKAINEMLTDTRREQEDAQSVPS